MTNTPATQHSADELWSHELELERSLAKHIILSILIAVPVMIVFWVGLIALAVSFTGVGYAAPLAMGAGIGVLAGVFWGAWAGFTMAMPALDEHEHEALTALRSPDEQHQDAPVATPPRTGNSESR